MASTEHPLKMAALAVVGTFGVLTAVVTQWVIPTVTASLSHDIDVLKERLAVEVQKNKDLHDEKIRLLAEVEAGKKDLEAEKSALRPRYTAYAKEIDDLREEISTLRMSNLFTPENPYPLGLDRVRIGDPIDKIDDAYNGKKIDKRNTTITVETAEEPFLMMVFNHSSSKETNGKIVGITYSYQKLKRIIHSNLPRISENWLEDSLLRNFGEPYVVGPENDCLLWKVNQEEIVYYLKGDDDFFVSGLVLIPAGCNVSDEQAKQFR